MSDNQIDIMLTEIDIAAQDMLMQSSCLPSYEGARHELRLIVRKHLARLPLPTVPTDATCGGCRWWRANKYSNKNGDLGSCYIDPVITSRLEDSPACRHYEGAAS